MAQQYVATWELAAPAGAFMSHSPLVPQEWFQPGFLYQNYSTGGPLFSGGGPIVLESPLVTSAPFFANVLTNAINASQYADVLREIGYCFYLYIYEVQSGGGVMSSYKRVLQGYGCPGADWVWHPKLQESAAKAGHQASAGAPQLQGGKFTMQGRTAGMPSGSRGGAGRGAVPPGIQPQARRR